MFKKCLYMVALVALLMTSCVSDTPEPPIVIELCKVVDVGEVETWVDRNGNGNRDPEDEPLPYVPFVLESETTFDRLTTNASGHLYYRGGVDCDDYIGTKPERMPQGYQLTSREKGICRFEDPDAPDRRHPCTSYGFTPTTLDVTVDANQSQEVPTVSTLDVRFERGEASSATLLVDYDCAFETGEIVVDFRESSEEPGPSITYEPALPIAVPRGSSGVELQATAVSSGTTYWLIVGLRSTTAECQDFSSLSPPVEYEADQIITDDCAVWKIVPHSRNWFPEIRGGIRRSSERKESDE